jgi:hypothetical protein
MKRLTGTWKSPDRCRINESEMMSENADSNERVGKKVAPVRRLRASILEMMLLVAALAVSLRWPGLTVPTGLLFLYALGRRRGSPSRQTRVALGQIALALYLVPAWSFLFTPPEQWVPSPLRVFSLVPVFLPAALIVRRDWVTGTAFDLPGYAVGVVVLSMGSLAVIGGLGVVAKRGIAWRITCLILALGMSGISTFLFWMARY